MASGRLGDPVASSAEDALRAIWQKHRAGTLERVGLIERAARALAVAELDEQLRVEAGRAAHTLIGSVGTFGFIRASDAARELERELANPTPLRAPEMSRLIAVIHSELQDEALTPKDAQRIGPAGDQLRVLVVDDDQALCERIAALRTGADSGSRSPARSRSASSAAPPRRACGAGIPRTASPAQGTPRASRPTPAPAADRG
jgi:HPt (histidine-containing phosphotransfer) domain-containing protein